jgi:hypothetical protein
MNPGVMAPRQPYELINSNPLLDRQGVEKSMAGIHSSAPLGAHSCGKVHAVSAHVKGQNLHFTSCSWAGV